MITQLSIALLPLAAAATIAPRHLPADFECPISIRATVPGGLRSSPDPRGGPSSVYGTMKGLHSVMSACSSITELELSITRVGGPDSPTPEDTPDRINFPFDQAGGDVFPSRVQTLSLNAYDFGGSEWEDCRPPGTSSPREHRGGPWSRKTGGLGDWADWLTGGRAAEWRRLRGLPDEQKAKLNIDLWLDAMDFSAVRNLTVLDLTPVRTEALVASLASRLPALKALSVTRIYGLEFLRSLPAASLSHLSIRFSSLAMANRLRGDDKCFTCEWSQRYGGVDMDTGRYFDGPTCDCKVEAQKGDAALRQLWAQHGGPQLEELEFRGAESGSLESREVLMAPQLRAMAAANPNLRKLAIDLDRDDGVWPDEEIRVLATEFPALESLSLYVEMASSCARELAEIAYYGAPLLGDQTYLGSVQSGSPAQCSGDDIYAKPMVNEATAAELSALLRRLNVESGSGKLSEVRFIAGDWTQPWDGFLYGGMAGLGQRTAWAACRFETADGQDKIHCDAHDSMVGGEN